MAWKPLRGAAPLGSNGLPGERGRYLIFLGAPLVKNGPKWVHFSWRGDSFCIRDYLGGQEMRQEPGLVASDVWRAAIEKQHATGEYFHPHADVVWWTEALKKLPTG